MPKNGEKIAFILNGYEFRGECRDTFFYGTQAYLTGSDESVSTMRATYWRPLEKGDIK